MIVGRATLLSSRGERRARPGEDGGEHTAAGGRGSSQECYRCGVRGVELMEGISTISHLLLCILQQRE